jgi:PTS system nitrogen regulatory IIA component
MDLTVRDAAKLLHTTENRIYRWISDGILPSYRINDRLRLNRVELLEWATSQNIPVSPEIFREERQAEIPATLLTDAIAAGGVLYDVPGTDRASALRAVCDAVSLPAGVSRDDLYAVLLAREALGSTAIGNGIAIPHPRSPLILSVKQASVTLAFLRQPIDFAALDGKPVDTLFTIISPTVRLHLQVLSHLMAALRDERFAAVLRAKGPAKQILAALRQIEEGFAGLRQQDGNGQGAQS